MTIIALFTLNLLFLTNCALANHKPNIYLYFENNALVEMSEVRIKTAGLGHSKSKTNIEKFNILYTFKAKAKEEKDVRSYRFITLDESKFLIVNRITLRKHGVITNIIKFLEKSTSLSKATDSKAFPFAHVYIVEKMASEKFKISEVVTYIGIDEDFSVHR